MVLSLTGVLLAAFVPTFLKHVHTSKLAEATELLERLHRNAALYYEHEHHVGSAILRGCLPESAGPYPLLPSEKPVSVDFASDQTGAATWRALGVSQPQLLRYRYQVSVSEPGCAGRNAHPSVTFRAEGDLDGDGTLSTLERTSMVEQDELVPKGPLRVIARIE